MIQSFRRILHPTDFTPRDALPFQVACALARGLNAELIVMHSAPMKELHEVPGYRAEIERRLNGRALSKPGLKITTNLLSGDPASRIVEWANESLCDAIVMRQSRKNWLVGRFVDSVSQRVKRLAHCPVILIPGETVTASVLKKGDRHRPPRHFREKIQIAPEPVPVFQQPATPLNRDRHFGSGGLILPVSKVPLKLS